MEPVRPYSSEISSVSTQLKKPLQYLTSRYMPLPLRTARVFWLKMTAGWTAVRPAPASAGDPPLVSWFLHPLLSASDSDDKCSNV